MGNATTSEMPTDSESNDVEDPMVHENLRQEWCSHLARALVGEHVHVD